MREIKFRAWHKADKKMYVVLGFVKHQWFLKGKTYPMPTGAIVIRQYTGLKDKNGKEIYEGDIIKRYFEIGKVIFNEITLGAEDYEIEDSGYFVGVVCYRPSEGFILNQCKKYNDDGELQSKKSGVKIFSNHAKVIGNIYENPELLKVGE